MLDHQKTKNFPKEVRLSRGQTKHLMRKTTTKNQHSLFLFFRLDLSGVYCYPHPHSCEYFIHVVNKFFSGFIVKLCPHGRQKVLFKTPLEPIFCTKGFAVGHIERYRCECEQAPLGFKHASGTWPRRFLHRGTASRCRSWHQAGA